MEHNHGGLVQIIFLSKWVICRFHVNFPGCKFDNHPFHNLSIRLNRSHLNGIFPDLQLRDFGLGVIVLVITIIQRYGGT